MPPRPNERATEAGRYVLNGVTATLVHFCVLSLAMEVMHVPVAAAANFVAAIFGITISFLGSRYFVFRRHTETITAQAVRFAGLYVAIALLHASVLFVSTDWLKLDFRIGFLIATAMQVSISYFANRHLVFAR